MCHALSPLTWDFALEHFRERERTKGPVYGFVEALVAGFLASTADLESTAGPASVAAPAFATGVCIHGDSCIGDRFCICKAKIFCLFFSRLLPG